ncbi:probable inactive peptidyl-prolyl cis-trans isomerase-like 6 isoform X1 [Scyliorhinus canicula]|uniref:probable inactive peptidyl-prolyl cis-trans isomerase-like 6 isoform X1 n=1 Tax=Scyliorhinus canicula TaxID=7830 RepID=UPI0018F6B018|nr:probable inactive peptidyl-prolyl cis-trans isomerase-like 6 isoform X1 [Scyliorhinus canicula]
MFTISPFSMAPTPCLLLEVVGCITDPAFCQVKCEAEVLKQTYPSQLADPVIRPLLEFAWHVYLDEAKKTNKGNVWGFSSNVMCFVNGLLLGGENDFLKWAEDEFGYTDFRPQALYEAIAEDSYSKYLKGIEHTFIYMDICIDQKPIGRLLFELFTDVCPKTCKNFEALCTGEAGFSPTNIRLFYKETTFHRLVKNTWIQGGDIFKGRGDGGASIYGKTFEDETFAISHCKRGVLGMANMGRHTNGSQFYITLQPCLWMNTNFVAFGHVVAGTKVLEELELVPTYNERPTVECKIEDCGIYSP